MGIFKIDDIIAALLLSMAMFRRLETVATRPEDNRHVPAASFQQWKQMALRGYLLVAAACALKVAGSAAWFFAFKNVEGVLQVGGLVLFVGWIAAVVYGWHQLTEARALKRQFNIGRSPQAPDSP
jgi:hypothetical protein